MTEPCVIESSYAQLGEVRLHYTRAAPAQATGVTGHSRAPLVLFLHGFPEFSYSWRHQQPTLAAAGFECVAPDMRGYNLSDKPKTVAAYRLEALVEDARRLILHLGHEHAYVVGHDWGGMVAWWLAMLHPEVVTRLSIMNCPHPGHQLAMMTSASQLRRSWYMLFFQLPWLPERRLRHHDFAMLRKLLAFDPERPNAFSTDDIERYVEAFRSGEDGGTVRAAINYYRALLRRNPLELQKMLRPIDKPVQVIWGEKDKHLGREYAEPPARLVWDLRTEYIADASHWVQVDRPDRVNRLLLDFLPAPG